MGAKLGGSGGGKYEEEANSSINVTPFVDVMLVLLIIFMVAAPGGRHGEGGLSSCGRQTGH
jgi:biopolymer transport protein ExbD